MLSVDIEKQLELFKLDLKFDIEKEVLAIQGASGSGKTTILNIISGLVKADRAEISNGDTILESTEKNIYLPSRKRDLGYMFQNYGLFPHLSVEKNIKFAMKDREIYEDLLDVLRLRDLLKRYPSDISGGEKQRVALLRTLVTKPKVLLMDEPFSALDAELKEKLYPSFSELIKSLNIPVLIITHDNDEANFLADNIIHIDKGKITA
ncbi:ATP-binding cassette domain-containing protein [Mediannikoviicoccus vaginalis]|uniref:ATP-binding cassette domain-containing protein n=1 Tax=Mediannikoviicoccus vaginalis TaxID=2899727 RepID=UPI001F027861|nr:ATP-binding cassette domain-containing protein [Mediannikoviicoccus vaginalis]